MLICDEKWQCGSIARLQTPGPGFTARPDSHLFFRRIEPLLQRHLDKAERENGFIYHQRVPDECPALPEKATFGLAKAEPFVLPPAASVWNKRVYESFDVSKATMPDFSKVKKSGKELPQVKEEKIYQTDREPGNLSGCVVA
jgi:hypothetical protein